MRRALLLSSLLAACSDAEPLGAPRLVELELEGMPLTPAFSAGTTRYTVDAGLLAHRVRVHGRVTGATGELGIRDQRGEPSTVERGADGSFSATAPLALGVNELELAVGSEPTVTHYTLGVTRHPEPWHEVQVLGLEPPVENAYFGDYLRASEELLYVNASRRGRLYRKRDGAWVFDGPSEALLPMPLEWMYEAAVTDDALAFVAQPLGGTETLFAFARDAEGRFALGGEHETGTQGTLRLVGDELVFATAEKVDVLRRTGESWALVQTLPAPAAEIGFALRPTYFDAPGVALTDGILVVGAPLASSPTLPGADPAALGCRDGEECAFETGAVLVYERDADGVYRGPSVLRPPSPVPGLRFGHATALDGDWLAVGAPRDGGATLGVSSDSRASVCEQPLAGACVPESGAVFLFHREATGFSAAGMLKPSVTRAYDAFGDALVVKGDLILVGTPGQDSALGLGADDGSALDSGGLFAFVRDASSYREVGLHKLPAALAAPFPFPETLELAGAGLAIAANTAPGELSDGAVVENAGRAYFLTW